MKKKILILIAAVLVSAMLTACGEDRELTQFRKSIDDFCDKVSQIDSAMNNIDAEGDNAVFQSFAKMDFPAEFDYLEQTADEASTYMTTAVENYHEAYSNGSYNEYIAEYAYGNYSRACKRVQIILSFLRGETPDDVDIITEPE